MIVFWLSIACERSMYRSKKKHTFQIRSEMYFLKYFYSNS